MTELIINNSPFRSTIGKIEESPNASTGKNASNPTEKPDSALNLPKSSQTTIINANLTDGIMTSKPTDITV